MKIKFNTKISLLILSTLLLVACGNTDSEKKEASEESSIKEEQPVATGI
ncbi:MAG TPA: efflux RND transporter periplasmic adaptor subunit, partial [Aequorivita sp.]|nr:efflux RND transporter periplasmic adaptor subunit [Aequorivita sp.]